MKLRTGPWLVLSLSLIVSFGVWHWVKVILAPAYTARILAEKRPIGNNSDLYPRWLGAREMLLHRRNPYGADLTREIQTGFYGRPLDAQNPRDPTARESFVYPLYVAFLLAPTVNLPFSTAAEIFRWLLLASIAFSVPLWMYALRLRFRWPLILAGTLLAVSSYPAAEEYFQQNLAALVIFFLAAAAAAAANNRLTLSGFLLALATVKPDTSSLVVLWFLLWATGRWKERKRLFWSFTVTMVSLLIASEAMLPGWFFQFVAAVREYPTYGTDPSILRVLLPAWLAGWFGVALIVLLAIFCWRWRKAAPASDYFGWALALVVSVTLVVLPKLAAYNQLLLIPALLMLAGQYGNRGKASLLARAMTKGAFACQIWQWLAATALSICSILLPLTEFRAIAEAPLYTLLALPPLTLAAAMLCALSLRGSFDRGLAHTAGKPA